MHFTVGQIARYFSIEDPTELEIAACYYNTSVMEVGKRPVDDLDIAVERMNDLDSVPAIFKERLWLNEGEWNVEGKGIEYGIINDFDKILAKEYLDIKEYQREFYPNATRILSILYRPVVERYGNSYRIAPYNGTDGHEIFASLPAQYLNGAMLFFSKVRKACARTSVSYLTKKLNPTSSV